MSEQVPYTLGEKLLGGSPKVTRKSAPRRRTAAGAKADAVEVPRSGVIRRPDMSDAAFMERMRVARRERGLRGLVEALVEECELPEGWVLDADVHPE